MERSEGVKSPKGEGVLTDPAGSRSNAYFSRKEARIDSLEAKLAASFADENSIIWEVGCGHGHFLTAFAQQQPNASYVGIDLLRDRIARAERKKNRAKLPRLHFLVAEAGEFLTALPAHVKISAAFILFPDPWPKRRHHKNRVVTRALLAEVAKRAGDGARLYFRTDFEPYFAEVTQLFRNDPGWELSEEPWPFETPTVFQARAPTYYSLVARRRVTRT
jgi:tRNA (guanine-N7-)-methyltransferase